MSSFAPTIAAVDRVFFAGAAALSVYMAISTFVFLQHSPRHYATLVFALLMLSGLLALRDVLAEGQARRGLRFWVRLTLAGFVLVGGALATAYIGLNADRLQIEQPFLNERDVVVGAVFLAALLVANWFHWGGVLTSVIGAVILYFFLGHLIERPLLLKHPHYDVAFVMSYMGMNTTEGAFAYLADVFILDQYRGKGLSKWLMECIMAHPELQGLRTWMLFTRDAHGLYRRFGFETLTNPERAMAIRNPDVYRQSAEEQSQEQTT